MRKDEATKGSVGRGCRSVAMDGYQPTTDELTKGYRVTQQVDMSNLKIPKNLGTAAVMLRNGGNSVHTPVEPKRG